MKHLLTIVFVLCSFSLFSQVVRDTVITGTQDGKPISWEVWELTKQEENSQLWEVVERYETVMGPMIENRSLWLEIYTNTNIFFVNVRDLCVVTELGDKFYYFPTQRHLNTWLAYRTAEDARMFNCTRECSHKGH